MQATPLGDDAFRAIVEGNPDSVLLVDARGLIVYANSQTERIFRIPAADLLGRRIEVLIPERLRPGHVVHREVYQEHPETRAMGSRLDLVGRRADGSELPIEVSLSPLRLANGQTLTMAVARDITQRKRADAALRRSEERHRLLAEHVRDIIYRYRLRPEPGFDYVSPAVAPLTGYTPEDFYAEPGLIARLVHPDDASILSAGLSEHAPEQYVLRVNNRVGDTRWFEQHVTRILDADGHVVALEGIARDITDRRRAEEERSQLLAEIETRLERERIAGDLHDDIIQSIYAVGLGLHADRADDGADKRTALDRAIEGLSTVISALRTYMQQLNGDFDAIAVNETLAHRLRSLTNDPDPLEWTVEVPTDCTIEPALDRHLYLLAKELVSNVRRHAHATHAGIELRRMGTGLVLTVWDDGSGFDRQSVPAHSYGLRSVDHRVGMLGGTIEVDSQPGRGTRIIVHVPLEPAEALARTASD